MPAGVVKSKRDEKLWNEAKAYCRRKYSGEGDDFWRCVNGTYQKVKRGIRGKSRKD